MNLPRRMSLPGTAMLALCVALLSAGAPDGASAQADKPDKPIDLKPLIPPVFVPLPPNARVNPGAVGGTTDPYTTTPLQNPTQAPTQSAPGIKLTIPR